MYYKLYVFILIMLFFKPYDWGELDIEGGRRRIEIYCHNRESEACLIRVEDYRMRIILELPMNIPWNMSLLDELSSKIRTRIKLQQKFTLLVEDSAENYLAGKKAFFETYCSSFAAIKHIKTKVEAEPFTVGGHSGISILVFEDQIYSNVFDATRKLTIDKNLEYAGWFQVDSAEEVEEDYKISTFPHEYLVSWKSLEPVPFENCKNWYVNPTNCGFDIEAHSPDGKSFPDKYDPRCVITCISLVIERTGKENTRQRHSIVVGNCKNPENSIVYHVEDEIQAIMKMGDVLEENEVDMLCGHNILDFDLDYINQRLVNYSLPWPSSFTRIKEREIRFLDESWESSGTQRVGVKYPDISGRIFADTLPIFRSLRKLENYKLDTIAKAFLKRGKLDMSPEKMFAIYNEYITASMLLEKCTSHTDEQGYPIRYDNVSNGVWKKVLKRYTRSLNKFGKVVLYCNEDSALVLDLFNVMSLWETMVQFSNALEIRMRHVYLKGQQKKGLSAMFALLRKQGVIFNIRKKEVFQEKYEGALNLGTKFKVVGMFEKVLSGDLNSMYPSIILAFNLCFSTEITEEFAKEKGWVEGVDYHRYNWIDRKGTDIEREYDLRFIVERIHKGFVPQRLAYLLSKRKEKRNLMKGKENTMEYVSLDAAQLALKIAANSIYGMLGSSKNPVIPAKHIAALVTKLGRDTLMKIVRYMEYGGPPDQPPIWPKGHAIYGDSVTGDTPVLIRRKKALQNFVKIQDLPTFSWKEDKDKETGKESSEPEDGMEIWSDQGFTPIKNIIRHHTNKIIYRITTSRGVVKVTEDHSLLRPDGSEVRPKDVRKGELLMHSSLPSPTEYAISGIAAHCSYALGLFYGSGTLNDGSLKIVSTRERLLEAKEEMDQYYSTDFPIRENDGEVSIILDRSDQTLSIYKEWREILYDKFDTKRVPHVIINSPLIVVKRFLKGANLTENDFSKYDIGSAGIYYLRNRLNPGSGPQEETICEIIEEGPCNDYVYDLETENHHFSAGVGEIVVHNTDSVQFHVDHEFPSIQEMLDFGHAYMEKLSEYIAPLCIVIEKAGTIMLIGPKKYIFHLYDHQKRLATGEINPRYGEWKYYSYTGVEMVKRNQTAILHRLYERIAHLTMGEEYRPDLDIENRERERLQEVIDVTYEMVIKTLFLQYPKEDYIIYQGYHKEGGSGAMSKLVTRMTIKGRPIALGDRVGFVYVRSPYMKKSVAVGDKMRLLNDFDEEEELDTTYYVRLMATSIDALIKARYINGQLYPDFLKRKRVVDVVNKALKKRGKLIDMPSAALEQAFMNAVKATFMKGKAGKQHPHMLPADYDDLISLRNSEEYESVDRGVKTAMTRSINEANKLGYPLVMTIPHIINNILLAEDLGILQAYTQCMASPSVYNKIFVSDE